MLESINAYFPDESTNNDVIVNLKYRDYKSKYATNKTVIGSYDATNKTIDVIFPKDQAEKLNNLGNKYQQETFSFLFQKNDGTMIVLDFEAKTKDNAIKNMEKYTKGLFLLYIREVIAGDGSYAKYERYNISRGDININYYFGGKINV